MNKWVKWILIIVLVSNGISYLYIKNQLPKHIVQLIGENGCEGYEPVGANIPFDYLFVTETKPTVYVKSDERFIDLTVKHIDPSLPLLKGFLGNSQFMIEGGEVMLKLNHCFKRKEG